MSKRRVCNVEVRPQKGEEPERLLKRFMKKCKKEDIVKLYLSRVSYFKTRKERRKEKMLKNKWLKNKDKI